jgi:glycosyltransferase involved in cell wall biosynthesis
MNGERAASRSSEAGPLRIVHVGSLIPRKNLHTLINALAQVPKAMWRLDVVGSPETDPGYARMVRGIIAANGLERQVTLLGTLTGVDLARYYSESHVLAVPSSYEGFGIVYLEGMGFGLPALASTTGAAHEIVTHGLDGFLVEPNDAESIAGHIRSLCEDRQLLAAMGMAALERYQRHPTWTDCAATIRTFLVGMVSRSKANVHREK